jgi:hypothetical protein
VRPDEGLGWARVQAGSAAAASLVRGGRGGGLELEVYQELAQKDVAAGAGRDNERGLAVKAEPRARRELALEQRRRIDAHARFDGAPGQVRQRARQCGEPLFHHQVVIVASCIKGDSASEPALGAPWRVRTMRAVG